MDIPLPGEPDPQLAKLSTEAVSVQISSPHNIPLPSSHAVQLSRSNAEESTILCSPPPLPPDSADGEDSNRYSPSRVTGDDDTGKDDQHDQESSHHGSPLVHSLLGAKGTRTTVLGKAQAKKRLLAFSMTKQGGGQGLSFGFNKKAPNKMSTGSMPFAGTSTEDDAGDNKDKDDRVTSPKKKGMGKKGVSRDDKARAVVSAIEEIKREEMLMRGVLGYSTPMGVLGDQTYPLPLMSASVLPPAKPRDDLEMSNILSEQQKGAIEELLGSLLTHDSDRKSKDEEKERRKSDEKRKRDSEKSSRHSKERHRSKERHSRSGREREKEEKKHRTSELPKNWQQFRDRGFKFEEIRRLKLKLEKDKLASNNRERIRKTRDREHRSRSREKRHKSPNQSEDKDKTTESDYDIMSKPFESTSRLIYPFMAVGIRQMQKQYPRSLIRFTKFRPSIPYCENPATSKAYYRTREEILCEASQRVVDLMHCVINGDLCKAYVKTEKNYKTKQTTDTNLSNSLAALQVSYDETEIDENLSSSDDASGTRRERPWLLPENLVVWQDGEEVCVTPSSDVEMNVKRERSDETDVDNYKKKKDSSVDSSEVMENEMPNYVNCERERDMKSSEPDVKSSLRSSERTTVRSKWDSDYEDDRVQEDSTVQSSHMQISQTVHEDAENWEEKDNETNFPEICTKDEIPMEIQDKSGSDSDNSSDSSSESSSAIESNTEDTSVTAKNNRLQTDRDKETEYKQNHKNIRETDEGNVQKPVKSAFVSGQEGSTNNAHPENSGDGNTNLKLASEYEEFMKAVSFESSVMEDGDSEIPSSEHVGKGTLKQGAPEVPPQEKRERRNSVDAADSEASHDKLDIEPARIEETEHLKKLSDSKLHNKPKLMTSSASEDELLPPEKEEKQESKVRAIDNAEQNSSQPRREKKQRSSSSDSSSSSESSVESEEVKEKRKSKSKKVSKKKRKKVVHNKKKQRKTSKKKRVNSSSSSESESSSNADSSSSSSSDDNKKKQKHKEKSRRRAKSSSSEESDNDSSSENVSSDDHTVRKKKKKKKTKRAPKKKPSKKRKRNRKETDSSDSEENVRSRRSKSARHKNSKKDVSKENEVDHFSNDEKQVVYEDSNNSSHHKDSEIRIVHNKKQSGKSKGGSNDIEMSQKKSSKKYKDNSSVDENYGEEREKKGGSRKKSSSSYKKSSNYRGSETSEDESDRKTIKKRRRERRSCTTSPVVSSNKKRRRSPSTSPEHSPTPQRRNSTEGKTVSQRERSKEQSSSSRKLKHSSGSNKKGHKQKDLEGSVNADDYSEECLFKRNEDRRRFRNSDVLEADDWEVNSSNEDSCDTNSNSREEDNSDDMKDLYSKKSPRKNVYQEDFPVQLLRSEDIKKEVCSEEEEEAEEEEEEEEEDDDDDDDEDEEEEEEVEEGNDVFMEKECMEENAEKTRSGPVEHTRRCVSDEDDDNEDDHGYQKQSRLSSLGTTDTSNMKPCGDKFSFVKIKIEPEDVDLSDTEKDMLNPEAPQLYSPDRPDEENSKSHHSRSQSVISREMCSTDSSQFSQIPDKVMDRYGSDISQESFRDSCETNFAGKLFRKQNYSVSEEKFRSGSRNPETPRVVPARGTNFTLDNIPLPPVPTNREETDRVIQMEDLSNSAQSKQINNNLSEKLPILPPPELCSSSANSIKLGSQRHVISFKLLSPSCRLQSSQALVDSSDTLGDEDSNLSLKHNVTQEGGTASDVILEPVRKIESVSDEKSGTSGFESSRNEWLTDRRVADPVASFSANITSETTNSEVSSSSKISVLGESGSSNSDVRPKERQRKRPSRWGMTTVPPKKKVIEELYESLPKARNEADALSQIVNEKIIYDQYVPSDLERKETVTVQEIHGISLADSAVKKSTDSFNKISEKKVESDNRTKCEKLSEWELPESVEDQNESWEVSRDKDASHKIRYTLDKWHDSRGRRGDKFTTEKVEKDTSEGCGPLIDWENDLEQSKSMNNVLLTTEDVNLYHYSREPEQQSRSKNSSQAQSCMEKGNVSQDESESEWETREVNYHSKSPAFRSSEVKPDTKEKVIRERQEPTVEKSSQRHAEFQNDDRPWEERKWHNPEINASKWEDRRHKEEIHESRRDDPDIRKDIRDKRRIEEGRVDDMYRDVRGVDDNAVASNKEKARIDESQTSHDEYVFREKYAEDRRDERDPNEKVPQTSSHIKHSEDRKLSILVSGEHTRSDKSDDQHRKDEKEKVLRDRERRDNADQDAVDGFDKNRKEYMERLKRDIDERERDEDRVRRHSGERERDRREAEDDQRREDRNRKDYLEGERGGIRDKERREGEIRDSRHDEELIRKDYAERERCSMRERERRDTRERRDERRRDRDRERRSDRRERERWEREKRDRHREERENSRRSRSPVDYHHERDRREAHREERQHSRSPPAEYWQGEWDRDTKERDCDCTGNYYVQDIPLPINSTMGGPSGWPSGATGEADMELSCSPASSPLVGFKRSLADSTISDSELVSCKQEDIAHRSQEMSPSSTAYPPGITPSKLYERKHPYLKQVVASSPSSDHPLTPTDSPAFSPKRLSLDDRIEMELGVKNTRPPSISQYQVYQHQQPPPPPQQPPIQQQLPSTQSLQQQPSFPYAQYYAHVPPPTQFEPRNDKFLSMPPPPYGQSVDEYGPPQHMYPPPPVKPGLLQMPPPSMDAPPQKRRPPLLPTPNIRPLTNWDSPEAFIGAQPPQSSRVVQVGNVLQVVPVEVPPPAIPGPQGPSQSIVLQTGNVLQVIPSDALPNTLPPVSCSEPPPVSNSSSQVVQVGNVLQVIPGPTTSTRSGTLSVVAPPKSTFPPTSTHTTVQGLAPHMPPLHLPPMLGPPPGQVSALLPSPTHGPPNHPPPLHGPPIHPPLSVPVHPPPSHCPPLHTPPSHCPPPHTPPSHCPPPHTPPSHCPPPHTPPSHCPPPHTPPSHCPPPHTPPSHCPPPHTPPMRGPPIHTPPIQVPSVHGLSSHVPSPSQAVPLLTSPNLEMSPSPAITSPLVLTHGPVPPPVSGVQVTTSVATSPIPSIPTSGATVISSVSSATSVMPPNIVPTPVAAPISYSPPASPFLVPPVVHTPMVPIGLSEGTPVVLSQGDCPIPFLSSVEMAQASQMEEAERRRAERARRRAEKEKRRKEKEKRHQNKIKHATEMIIKKALEQEGEMLGTASDIDIEEMRLIEEAMQQVPEQEEELPQTDAEQQLRKKKRKLPVEIQLLPPAGKGILVSPGFREKPLGSGGTERKSVKFADGVRPGEGTSPSAGEDLPSPPPPPRKLPKEKRYKKKKKKKIKVKIIRQINVEDEDDDEEDISPPPPPPGSPPPPPMYPSGAHYPPTYPPGFTYSTAPPFTVLPGVDSSTGAATGTAGNLFTPLYHQHHHTTTTTHTTTVQFAPPPPPATPVPPPPPNPHMFKREAKSNP